MKREYPNGELEEEYIGDGLYAAFDGWHLWLRAPRSDGDHYVAMEPAIFRRVQEAFEKYHSKEATR